MGMDNRDWYRDFWRKKTGYTERADFRISAGQHGRNQHRRAWRRNFISMAILVVALVLVIALFRFFRT